MQETLPTLHTTIPVLYQRRNFDTLLVEINWSKHCQGSIGVQFRQRHLCFFHTCQDDFLPCSLELCHCVFHFHTAATLQKFVAGGRLTRLLLCFLGLVVSFHSPDVNTERNEPEDSKGRSKGKSDCTLANSPFFVLDNFFARASKHCACSAYAEKSSLSIKLSLSKEENGTAKVPNEKH